MQVVCLEEEPRAESVAACSVGEDLYEVTQPHPLPMPEYGGYFAPLTEFLPDSSQPVNGFHRSDIRG